MILKAKAKEESSFCEQKEAKKLCRQGGARSNGGALHRPKVFCFFVSKKMLLPSLQPIAFTYTFSEPNRVQTKPRAIAPAKGRGCEG